MTRYSRTLTLTEDLRQELKNPLGTLIKGPPQETMKQLKQLIQKQKPQYVISIGDQVSQNMQRHGLRTRIIVVDSKIMRESIRPIKTMTTRKIDVKNPAGTLTPETWIAFDRALRKKQPVQVLVEGEEDLLTLVAVLESPENSLVVYGQPHEGIVVVRVDKAIKKRVRQIVNSMEPLPKS